MPPNLRISRAPSGELLLSLTTWDDAEKRWLKSLPGARWDPARRSWVVPPTARVADAIRTRHPDVALPALAEPAEGPARQSRAVGQHGPLVGGESRTAAGPPARPNTDDEQAPPLTWPAAIDLADRTMILRAFSPRTRKVYRNHLKAFARWSVPSPGEVTADDVGRFLRDLAERRSLSRSYHSQALSALRLLFIHVLWRPLVVEAIPRPKRGKQLPVVLSRDEVRRVIDTARTPHQRALVMTLYSTGLRVSELARLRLADIDADRGMVRVRGGKGMKDRYTLLSTRCHEAICEYLRYRPPDGPWLFPGGRTGRHITTRSVQKVVARVGARAGLAKRLTPHVLRHSFATHLLDAGTDIRFIQELLGHSSTRTTEIYTHVTRRTLSGIRNPLDGL